ncbi:MAG: hydroxymethylbilane synthase [Candidatus Latescibacter sp.]|nr:hydroxymethylbilane synthase [Candidatus Latescibacter sp.]
MAESRKRSMKKIILGSRGSSLALVQAELTQTLLFERFPDLETEICIIATEGDIDRTSPLSSFGGRGAFVRSIESALLKNEIDVAVHSLKDLPSRLPEGLALGAVPVREDPRDALISLDGHTLADIPNGSIIATGSDRRRIQLEKIRPDISFRNIRGNIETRIGKLGLAGIEGIVLACAGIKRLGLENHITQIFSTEELLPAPCQGALGLECRADDQDVLHLLGLIDNPEIRPCVDVERTFIATLGMGCHAPVAALASMEGEQITFTGLVAGKNGLIFRESRTIYYKEAEDAARSLAEKFRKSMEGL